MIESKHQKKTLYGRKFALCANCRFSKFTRNRLRKFFENCCAFPFSDAKSYGLKKTWGHRVNFLVISDISEKSGLENPFGMLPW